MSWGEQATRVPKAKGRRRWPWVLLAIFAVIGVIGAVNKPAVNKPAAKGPETAYVPPAASTAGQPPASAPAAKPAQKAKPASQLGVPVRDGRFEFTITKLQRRSVPGSGYLTRKAQGVYLLVHLTVRNIGTESQMLDGSGQRLFDAAGTTYSADDGAVMYLGDSAKTFLNQINPGNSVQGIVVFDVPRTVRSARMELHDSVWSGGVDVRL